MAKDAVEVPTQRKPIGPFSYATRANGMLYVSGCIGVDDTWKVVGPDVTSQTRRTLEIIKNILDAAKVPLANVVKTTTYLTGVVWAGCGSAGRAEREATMRWRSRPPLYLLMAGKGKREGGK